MPKMKLFQIFVVIILVVLICQSMAEEILRVNLNAPATEGVWTVTGFHEKKITLPATVPGGIYSDLSAAGNIFKSEIYHGYNDLETRWVSYTDWSYGRKFEVSREMLEKDKVQLTCDGLDTVSKVFVNGIEVGSSNNMFVRYVFNVKNALKEGTNDLRIEFKSPVQYTKRLRNESAYPILPECVPPEFQGECHVNYIRKMQASFSWDWGPAYPSMGIWKDIYVEAFDSAVIRDLLLFIKSNNPIPDEEVTTTWTVTVRVYLDVANIDDTGSLILETYPDQSEDPISVIHKISRSDFENSDFIDLTLRIPGNKVRIWWPNGFGNGAHPLYPFTVTHVSPKYGEKTSRKIRGGYRTIELIEDPIDVNNASKGLSFYFKVNGLRIYAKGTNSIPIHVLPERATPDMIKWLFKSSVEAHFNMIRVWGGGIYEPDLFYDLADENGILIWEDFMFAVNLYPTTNEFLGSVHAEVDHQVKRLQHHASLAIWATNNENEVAVRHNWFGSDKNYDLYAKDYVTLYIETILKYVMKLDPSRHCLPSSPTNGKGSEAEGWIAKEPYSTLYGDVHFYNYVKDGWDYRHLLKTRFASEYGYQAWPHPSLLKAVTEPEDWHWYSHMMFHRQRHPGGQQEMEAQIRMHLPVSSDVNSTHYFESMLYLAQITQAMSVKVQTEFYRRLKSQLFENGEGQCAGALYWQLNDIWPGASWASIETTGRWKMLHNYAKNFFAPVITSAFDNDNGDVSIYYVSDLKETSIESLRIRLFQLDSMTPIFEETYSLIMMPDDAKEAARIPAATLEECKNSVSICLLYMTMTSAPDNFFFLHYPNDTSYIEQPNLRVLEIQSLDDKIFEIQLQTDKITPFVFLNLKANHIRGSFSDNGFVMVEPWKQITFTAEVALDVDFLKKNLEVLSLHDAIKD